MEGKFVKGFQDKYIIYENGSIYNVKKSKYVKIIDYPNSPKAYPKAVLFTEGNVRLEYRMHRLVAEYFIENPDNLPIINHKDGNIKNYHKDNLEWCNHSYNYIHARDVLGTCAIGERHPCAILTDDDVRFIRRKYFYEGYRQCEIVKMKKHFSRRSVGKVCSWETWKHIKDF